MIGRVRRQRKGCDKDGREPKRDRKRNEVKDGVRRRDGKAAWELVRKGEWEGRPRIKGRSRGGIKKRRKEGRGGEEEMENRENGMEVGGNRERKEREAKRGRNGERKTAKEERRVREEK